MLEVRDIQTGYGKKQVLFGLSMHVRTGEIVALIGPNGAGKSTVLKAIFGLLTAWEGKIFFDGAPINGATPAENVRRGITFAPQGSRVFHDLTVMENLEMGAYQLARLRAKERINHVLELFPSLAGRIRQSAGRLSGGEQQMLALARALIPEPKLLMLDEPTLGLAPNLAEDVIEKVIEINREKSVSILLVEQNVRKALDACSRVYSVKLGKVAFDGLPAQLRQDKARLRNLFI